MIPHSPHDWRSRQLARLGTRARRKSQARRTGTGPPSMARQLATGLDAKQLESDRTAFMSSLSHALLTPLHNIYGYAQLLDAGMRGPLTPDQRHDVHRIQANERHLMRLVNSVIAFARWEDEESIALEDIAAHAAVLATHRVVHQLASAKGVRYTTDLSAIEPSLIMRAEPTRLHAILLHLLMNAITFTPAGSTVGLRVLMAGDSVWIRVNDDGVGIPSCDFETIFTPFARGTGAEDAAPEGDGLGLCISRKLARSMGGEILVTSTVGRGSTFTLSLPRGRSEERTEEDSANPTAKAI